MGEIGATRSSGRKRVLFVVNHAGFFLSHRLSVALAAGRAGYEVHVATPASKHVPRIIESGLQWHEISLSRSGVNPLPELRTLRSLWRLYRALRPDVVHHVTSKPVLYGTIVARAAGVPAVVNAISGVGHVFASSHGIGQAALRAIVSVGYRLALRHRRMRVIFQNPEHQAVFIARRWVTPADCVMILGSGVDPVEFAPAEVPASHGMPVVVFASRMLYTKGLREFVGAARRLRQRGVWARFLLVGEPDPDNRASVPQVEIDEWVAEGIVESCGRRSDMAAVFRGADIVCLPSYSEGMPKVLVEAAATALPIVTTDIAGCRDIVRHEENGLLVPPRESEKLADALERLIKDGELRRRMGARGRQRVLDEFTLSAVIARMLSLYGELT